MKKLHYFVYVSQFSEHFYFVFKRDGFYRQNKKQCRKNRKTKPFHDQKHDKSCRRTNQMKKLCNIIVLNEEYTDVPICFSDLDSKICPICAILACPKAKERLPGKKELKPTKDISVIGHKNNQHKRPTAPATGLNFYKKAKDPLPRSEF